MAYVSLYRKYRPQTFDEVVGQEHVTATLKNAVVAGRVGSGYLFTGTRGTAKTTCARILAKALNCIGEDAARTNPAPTPCGVCGPCRSIASSSFVDVLEMDAASHGKVDDVRDLVSSIKFPPMEGRYKVYIIDEAHQLSRDAMDAFLKTLEEPPDRVVFILATTELDKLPITIASRCQVFEFKRGSVAAISSRLTAVLAAEGVTADPSAVTLIARAADGSYRDSLSLLEQVLAYKPNDLLPADVAVVLGTVDEDMLSDIVARIAANDTAGAFAVADAITSAGKDVQQFLRTLSGRLRDMLFVAVGAHANDGEVSAAARREAGVMPPVVMLRILEVLSETERDLKWSSQHRLVLEITLLRLCSIAGQTSPTTAPEARMPDERSNQDRRQTTVRPPPAPARTATPDTPAPAESPSAPAERRSSGFPYPNRRPAPESHGAAAASPAADDAPGVADPVPIPPVISVNGPEPSPAPSALPVQSPRAGSDVDLLQVQQIPAETTPVDTRPNVSTDGPADLIRLQKSWQEVINRVGGRSVAGATVVRDAFPIRLEGGVVTLKFTNPLHVDSLDKKERGRQLIEEMINRTLGVEPNTYRIKCVLNEPAVHNSTQVAPAAHQSSPPLAVAVHEEPGLVETVIAVFGGQIQDD